MSYVLFRVICWSLAISDSSTIGNLRCSNPLPGAATMTGTAVPTRLVRHCLMNNAVGSKEVRYSPLGGLADAWPLWC